MKIDADRLISIAMLVVIGLCAIQFFQKQNAPPSARERFHLLISPLVRADRFLLDAYTGDIWQIVQSAEGRQVLQRVPYSSGGEEPQSNFERMWNESKLNGK